MFTYRCPLRWSDLDAQGHVNNVALVDMLQESRVALFRAGPASSLLSDGVVVVSHQVEYLASVGYAPEPIRIDLGVSALGGARFELAYEVFQDGLEVARARTVLCPFDFASGKPVRLPANVREHLAAHRLDVAPLSRLEAPALGERGTQTELYVRWSDADSYGHINNSMAYEYIQQARIMATTQWDPAMTRAGERGARHNWLVARQDVDYLAQLGHSLEPYVVRTAPTRIGTTSLTLAAEIADPATGELYIRGRTILVCADADFRPTPLPDTTRAALAQHLVA